MSEHLTPEEIEQWVIDLDMASIYFSSLRNEDGSFKPVERPHMEARTLRAYAEVVEGIAEMDPIEEYDGIDWWCVFCTTSADVAYHDRGQVIHKPGCLWLRARELRGKA